MSAAQKTPLAQSLDRFTRARIQNYIQLTGKAVPARVVAVDGAIVTIEFLIQRASNEVQITLPQVTCPLFGPEYIRYPIQVGDLGCVFPSDYYLGGVSGLGGGVADLSDPGNLSALVFFPVGNKTWFAVDPNSVTIYGPNGVTLFDTGKNTTFTLTPSGIVIVCRDTFQITTGACTFLLQADGTFNLTGGTAGLVSAPELTLSDGTNHTSPSIMDSAWVAFITAYNSHTHPETGTVTDPPTVPYTGGSIAPT